MTPDLRLLPAALAAWAVALVGLHLGWSAAAALGAAGVGAVVADHPRCSPASATAQAASAAGSRRRSGVTPAPGP